MRLEQIVPIAPEAVEPTIFPDIGSVSPMSAQFDVEVVGCPALEHEHKLVLRAIKRPHSGIVLDPDADVFEGQSLACLQDLGGMAPIHTHKKDRSVDRE